jgi:hypothetical protein
MLSLSVSQYQPAPHRASADMQKRILAVLIYPFVHVGATIVTAMVAYGAAMKGFEDGRTASPHSVNLLTAAAYVLQWPVVPAMHHVAPGFESMALFFANGLLWAASAAGLHWALRRRRTRSVNTIADAE